MDFLTLLQNNYSSLTVEEIVSEIAYNRELIGEYLHFVSIQNKKIKPRAAWVVGKLSDSYPDALQDFQNELVGLLESDTDHKSVRRNAVKALIPLQIEEGYHTVLIDYCIRFIESKEEPIAVKVYSMKLLTNFALIHPEINNEAFLVIQNLLLHATSAGILSIGKKCLKKLS